MTTKEKTDAFGLQSSMDRYEHTNSDQARLHELQLQLAIIATLRTMHPEQIRERVREFSTHDHQKIGEEEFHFDVNKFMLELAAHEVAVNDKILLIQERMTKDSSLNSLNSQPKPIINFGSGSVKIDDSKKGQNY